MFKNLILISVLVGSILDLQSLSVITAGNFVTRSSKTTVTDSDISRINFIENSWNAAIKKAAAEKKLIFVDAYAVWCAPCRQLKATTFKDKAAAAFFNKNFVNLSMDMEKGEGIKLSEKWGVEEFPTLIILDHKGKVVTGNVGFMDAPGLIRLGQQALKKNQAGL